MFLQWKMPLTKWKIGIVVKNLVLPQKKNLILLLNFSFSTTFWKMYFLLAVCGTQFAFDLNLSILRCCCSIWAVRNFVSCSWKLQGMLYTSALVLAGIELIFFVVANMVLCFGFVLEAVLVIQGCFPYCWAVITQSQGLFCFSPQPTSERLGGHKELGGDTARTADPSCQLGLNHDNFCS